MTTKTATKRTNGADAPPHAEFAAEHHRAVHEILANHGGITGPANKAAVRDAHLQGMRAGLERARELLGDDSAETLERTCKAVESAVKKCRPITDDAPCADSAEWLRMVAADAERGGLTGAIVITINRPRKGASEPEYLIDTMGLANDPVCAPGIDTALLHLQLRLQRTRTAGKLGSMISADDALDEI